MSITDSLRFRRSADKVRLVGWINAAITLAACFVAEDRIGAFVIGAVWLVVILGVTQIVAWRLDVKANRIVRE